MGAFVRAGVFVKAVLFKSGCIGDVPATPQVPFSEVPGRVTGVLKKTGDGGCPGIEKIGLLGIFVMLLVVQVS